MKIAIIGAGAAGCFAAANMPYRQDMEVAVFEKTGRVMQKVKVSGGGRCNVTHACFDVPGLIDCYPRGKNLLKKTLHRFGPQQVIEWFERRGVKLKTEDDGRMFPITDDSQTIIDCVWKEMMMNKVQLFYHKSVEKIERMLPGETCRYLIHFSDASLYAADAILVASGGFPKAGQYNWIEALGHTIHSPVPSLFTFNIPANPVTGLMGVSVPDAAIKILGTKIVQHGPLLITHWGMSGPAVLKISAFAARELADRNYDFKISVNWLGDSTDASLQDILLQMRKAHGKQLVQSKNPFTLPRRLWEYQVSQCGIGEQTRWGDLPAAQQNKLVERLLRDTYSVKGKTTFKDEFVTCGGVNLAEIDPHTLESRVAPSIYFAGEILDVDGITGGYNFQHAWSSGWIAAKSIIDG